MRPVLFVLVVQNHRGYHGIRLDSEDCSAHNHEQQVLLIEKFEVYVIGIEEKEIKEGGKRMDEAMAAFIGEKLTIIHLFASG